LRDNVSVTCPGLFEGNKPISVKSERAEVISRAFNISTKNYFKKKHELKERIRQSEREIDGGRRLIHQGEEKIKDGKSLEVAGEEKKVHGRKILEESKVLFQIIGGIIGVIFLICLIISIVLVIIDMPAGAIVIVIPIFLCIFLLIPKRKRDVAKALYDEGNYMLSDGNNRIVNGRNDTLTGETRIQTARNNIIKCKDNIAKLHPEKKIKFISKTYLPFFLIPYSTGAMVFDGLGNGSIEEFSLVNLYTDSIEKRYSELDSKVNEFHNLFSNELVCSPEYAINLDNNKTILEKPLIDQLKAINDALKQRYEHKQVISIHKPGGYVSKCMEGLLPYFKSHEGKYPIIMPSFKFSDAKMTVEKLKGIETKYSTSDVHDQAGVWINRVEKSINQFINNCERSMSHLKRLYDELDRNIEYNAHRFVCPRCLGDKMKDNMKRYSEYNLEKFVEEKFNTPIQLLSKEKREQARKMIEEEINISLIDDLGGKYMPSIYELPHIDIFENGYECAVHKRIEHAVPQDYYSRVFATTSDSLWEELKEPVRSKVKDETREATRQRGEYKNQLLNILPLNQIVTQMEVESKKLEAELKAAEAMLNIQ